MKSAEIKTKVFTDFLAGMSLEAIARQPGMPCARTIERWSASEGWVAAREGARAEARKKAVAARVPELANEYISLDASKYRLAMLAVAQLSALVEGDLAETDLPLSRAELMRLVVQLTKRPS